MSAPALSVQNVTVQGFAALRITNGLLSFTLIPDLGAKISSLRDLRTGREWLWTSGELPLARHPYGASYLRRADTGGWDECFPTVAPCTYPLAPYAGTPLPDHGELWSQAWPTTVSEDGGEVSVHSVARGVALPYRFERRLRLRAGEAKLRCEYAVTNTGADDLAFIWSAHPLFRPEEGLRVLLPPGAQLRPYFAPPGTQLPQDAPFGWPFPVVAQGRAVPLDPLPGAEAGAAFKVWSAPLLQGWAELAGPDGRLRFTFGPHEVPQVGVWLNAGGWSGTGGAPYHNLALEPCIGAQDSLEDAVTHYGQFGSLPAHATRRWALSAHLLPSEAARA